MPGSHYQDANSGQHNLQGSPVTEQNSRKEGLDFSIVGIGASAGGLEACRKLLAALPAQTGMAFIFVQHLDPNHESLMVDLLAGYTSLTVLQAADGMQLERDHIYVIPPGSYLSVGNGTLRLSQPQARHGARLPFDFLLKSLAEEYKARAICVVLSGTGADGSIGLKFVKEQGGLVIVQAPAEATYDGMPRNALATGAVDLVLPLAEIPDALINFNHRMGHVQAQSEPDQQDGAKSWLSEIIDLLRTRTAHDFTLYKQGTLQRRIERRMAMAAIDVDDMDRYLNVLRGDRQELDLLAKDLLINVTSFFRDPQVFDFLATSVIPDLIRKHPVENPCRIWIAGCSTGEETYSLAMLFLEQIKAQDRAIKLQVFASDVDADAVVIAREGLYPETIEADVSAERLARYFSKEDNGYRVLPELRAVVVFTVQDVLADPPFSRLDFVSCRNLLIYLLPEAQAKVISLFHFALREGGLLLLGNAETINNSEDRFEIISKSERLYRHIGRSRPGEIGFLMGDGARVPLRRGQDLVPSRQAVLADLCRRLVTETFSPAAVLINKKQECLFLLGPTDRYLRVAPGNPSHDLLSMAPQSMRAKLRSAIQRVSQENARVIVKGARIEPNDHTISFSIDAQPVQSDGEELLLICFIDEPIPEERKDLPGKPESNPRIVELEQELAATRMELQGAIHNLEIATEEQKAVNEEALSVNEEFQSTNEELLTSKEELQSLNEELTALNSQLQETLERQRTTSNDLQNILYSTDIATIFLDTQLNIRFFTPATKALFSVIPTDIGRPLADLRSLAADATLLTDARKVLLSPQPMERQVEAENGVWYTRRILPYRTQDGGTEGVVITFNDITERKLAAEALEAAKRQAEQANIAKSTFLAAASHDLRQPLQTLALVQGLLTKMVEGEAAKKLVTLMDQTLGAMSGMLNTLLDINQIDAGVVQMSTVRFPINDLLERLKDEFTYHAQAHGLQLRVVGCGLSIESDPLLLEQMIRNLLSNALKYTKKGKVLLGCRRHQNMLSIEVLDTGIGIASSELQAIFDEYHQIDNSARERSRGLGLGLSIVQRLSVLTGHRVKVRSQPGKGSTFSIEIDLPAAETKLPPDRARQDISLKVEDNVRQTGSILIVEDDSEVRELLELLLKGEGHRVATARDGPAALELAARGTFRPDLIVADYNLPNDMNGLEVTTALREKLHREVPVLILTGDISTSTLRDIALQKCLQVNKPVKVKELTDVIQRLLPKTLQTLPARALPPIAGNGVAEPVILIVDDDALLRQAIRSAFEEHGFIVEGYATCEDFLEHYNPHRRACLLVDAYLPGMSGLELLELLKKSGDHLPAIMITGASDVSMAVHAMKAGALDFIEKPIELGDLIASVERAFERSKDSDKLLAWKQSAANHMAGLSPRQHEIMTRVLAGQPSKIIAADLGISQRTVENHRATIMKKTGAKSLPELARLALVATWTNADELPAHSAPLRIAGD